MRFAVGTPVRCETRKWPDRPHWTFDGVYLGEDEHGEWLGFPAGTHNSRPGYAFDSQVDCVTLVPVSGWYVATFHAPGIWCDTYIDISTPATWDGTLLSCVDLDLDVIRMSPAPPTSRPPGVTAEPGVTFIDDEDEFAEHQVAYGYPAEVVSEARRTADELVPLVESGVPPFGKVPQS